MIQCILRLLGMNTASKMILQAAASSHQLAHRAASQGVGGNLASLYNTHRPLPLQVNPPKKCTSLVLCTIIGPLHLQRRTAQAFSWLWCVLVFICIESTEQRYRIFSENALLDVKNDAAVGRCVQI